MQVQKFKLLIVFQIAVMGCLIWLLAALKTPWDIQRYVGAAMAIVGVFFVLVARIQLGQSFSIRPEAHELVTNGLYSKIRNPIYVFGNLAVAGIFLVLQRPALWIILAALVIVQIIRARREAQVLEAAFGEAYREYRRKTWF